MLGELVMPAGAYAAGNNAVVGLEVELDIRVEARYLQGHERALTGHYSLFTNIDIRD